jgi:formylglycine-generating enzyme required for sulfatase activity
LLVGIGCDQNPPPTCKAIDAGPAGPQEQRSCAVSGTPGCGLIEIPSGTLTLGEATDAGAQSAEPVQPNITVSAFAIDAFEVTKGRFKAFWAACHPAPSSPVAYRDASMPWEGPVTEPAPTGDPRFATDCTWLNAASGDDQPINCIDWETAQAFCVWDGGRLPTAAEWEYAARGTDGRSFAWGSTPPPDDAHACRAAPDGGSDGVCTVGTHLPGDSPFGVHDMIGNVREWNADWYQPYDGDSGCWGGVARVDPLCATPNADPNLNGRVIVGGSWVNHLENKWMHAATRYWGSGAYVPGEGVRCARSR